MNRAIATLSVVLPLALASAVASAAELQTTVPTRFQGEWASSVTLCGSPTDDLRLAIGASTIRFFESSGAIKAAVTRGERELALISELSGEGETWLALTHFRLSADENTLADVTSEPEIVRHRCPKRT